MRAPETSAGHSLRYTRCPEPSCSRLVLDAADADGRPLRLEPSMRGPFVEVAHVAGERNPRFGAFDARADDVSSARFATHVCRK